MSRSSLFSLKSPGASSARDARHHGAGGIVSALLAVAIILLSTACATSTATASRHATATPQEQHGTLIFAANTAMNGSSANSDIYALGLSDGKQLWHTSVGAGILVFGGAMLYLSAVQVGSNGAPSSTILALHASDGAPAWKHPATPGVAQAFAADSDAVFVNMATVSASGAIASNSIEALRASDGTPLWNAAQNGPVSSIATVGDGVIYLEVASGASATSKTPPTSNLLALDTSTGKTRWRLSLQNATLAPVLSGGVLYLAENNSQEGAPESTPTSVVLAVKASDGIALWHTTPPIASAASNIVVSSATICYSYSAVSGPGGGIVALHSADGSLAWQYTAAMSGSLPLAASNGVLYTVDQSKSAVALQLTLHAFDMSTGKSVFAHPFPNLPVQAVDVQGTPPQVADGVIYLVVMGFSGVPGSSGTPAVQPQPTSVVVALSASDGSLKWDRTLNGTPSQFLFVTP